MAAIAPMAAARWQAVAVTAAVATAVVVLEMLLTVKKVAETMAVAVASARAERVGATGAWDMGARAPAARA